MSIRLRLTLRHTVLLGLVLLVLSFIVYRVVAAQSMNRLDVSLSARAGERYPSSRDSEPSRRVTEVVDHRPTISGCRRLTLPGDRRRLPLRFEVHLG